MQDEIIRKLEAELHQTIKSERQVVYILVEIRKLMYRDKVPKGRYPHLRMLCDWAVHAHLDRDIVKEHLLILNSVADRLRTGTMTAHDLARSSKIFDLMEARAEFLNFIREIRLNEALKHIFGAPWWGTFLKQYVCVISDCPLVLVGKDVGVRTIRAATVKGCTVLKPGPTEGHIEFVLCIDWEIEFEDGLKKPVGMPLAIEKDRPFLGRGDRMASPQNQR
jgi:hypothetical protein